MKSNYTFSGKNKITATLVDSNYLWIAFFGASNICSLYKSSVFNPNLVYWNVDVTGDEITSFADDTTYLYASLDDTINTGAKVTKSNPSTITYFIKDAGITEKAIDLIEDTTYIYFLTPGIITNTKICKYNKSTRAFIETIDLAIVNNAKNIDIDDEGNIWVTSELSTTPKVTKVWYSAGWNYTTYTLS